LVKNCAPKKEDDYGRQAGNGHKETRNGGLEFEDEGKTQKNEKPEESAPQYYIKGSMGAQEQACVIELKKGKCAYKKECSEC